MSEKPDDTTKDKDEEELKPLQVEVVKAFTPELKPAKNPTSIDTIPNEYWDMEVTEEEIKEMTDAQ